jgi:hypothetical protein
LSRAAAVAGDEQEMNTYRKQARATAEKVSELEDRKMLLDDLETIQIN